MASTMTFNANLVPKTDGALELGSSSKKWKINGVADPKLTDTIATVTVSGTGNVITDISASNGAITATKGTVNTTVSVSGTGNVVTDIKTVNGTITATKGTIETTLQNLKISFNNGTTEGTNLYTYNGTGEKTLNIVPGEDINFNISAGSIEISALGGIEVVRL